jgi:hypothetical protein
LFFFFWIILGVFWFLEAASRGSFGWSILVIVVAATGLLVAYRPARRQAAGVIVGAALPMFLEALVLRGGPGIVCRQLWTSGHENCRYMANPAPWALGGILLVVLGIAVERYVRRRVRERQARENDRIVR